MDDTALVAVENVKLRRPKFRVYFFSNSPIKPAKIDLFTVELEIRSSVPFVDERMDLSILAMFGDCVLRVDIVTRCLNVHRFAVFSVWLIVHCQSPLGLIFEREKVFRQITEALFDFLDILAVGNHVKLANSIDWNRLRELYKSSWM